VRRYNGPGDHSDFANDIAVSPDGSDVFVTGQSFGPARSSAFATGAYDASNGAKRWARLYNGPGKGPDEADAIAVSPDGARVFVTGSSYGANGSSDYATVAYDALSGSTQWIRRYNGPVGGDDFATDVGVSPDGSRVFVTGASRGSPRSGGYLTTAYDAICGAMLWTTRGRVAGGANALGVSPDGSLVFVTGFVAGRSGTDFGTVAYEASTGATAWVRRYDGPADSDDSAVDLAVSPGGSTVYVVGYSRGLASYFDYATVGYDSSSGEERWVRRYNGPGNGFDYPSAVEVSPDASTVFVAGNDSGSHSGYDYATVAYEAATGSKRWVARYNSPANGYDAALALGVSPDESFVFVTGYIRGPTSPEDYGTVAYDAATGSRLWVRRYNGPANDNDAANALVVSPDGSAVFVTGYSAGSGTFADYATIAYGIRACRGGPTRLTPVGSPPPGRPARRC